MATTSIERLQRWAVPIVLLSLFLFLSAFTSPTQTRLPNIDKRIDRARSEISTAQISAVATLQSQVTGLNVEFDSIVGSPRFVWAGDKLLSSADSSGGAISKAALNALPPGDPHRVTKAFIQEHRDLFGHGPEALDQARVVREFTTPHNGLKTAVWEQRVDDVPVFEARLISHVTKNEELVNISSQIIPDPIAAADNSVPNRQALLSSPTISAQQAIVIAAGNIGEQISELDLSPMESSLDEAASLAEQRQSFSAAALPGETTARLLWLPLDRDRVALCWDVLLTSRIRGEMFRILVDVVTGEVKIRRCLTDYISDATYRVYTSDSPSPFSPGHATPNSAQPAIIPRTLLTLPALNTNASPNGWIDDGINETRGNNVDAHTDRDANNLPDLPRPQGSPLRVFDFALDLTQSPSAYTNAAIVQLFYWNNFMHDKLYELGFTEAAGNFQNNNFGRGGLGNDAVQADAQDGNGTDNANFSTPPDGSPGRMQMYLFGGPTPDRDGDLDAEIVLHEYTHGLSNRRVGGGVGISALQSGGMGEGWSDFYGLSLLSESGDSVNGNYAAGGYATYLLGGLIQNYYYGIRRYPYSTDLNKNPLTFKDIDPAQASAHTGIPRSPIIPNTANEVHNMGEVWCVTLWEARARLIVKYGWAAGNQRILQLVTDGMNLSPANPNFLQARDAILLADSVGYAGADLTELWAAFAKRGMGKSASSPGSSTTSGLVEAFDVPDALRITPGILSSSGPVGGPFTPNPAAITLTNTGAGSLNWSLGSTSSWFNISPTSGTLPASGPSTTVSITLTPSVTNLAAGVYSSLIRFTNQTSGVIQTATFVLAVVGNSMFDDFDPGIDLSQWSGFGGTIGTTILATNYGGVVSAPNSLWFGDAGSRFATSRPINTTLGGFISFNLRIANGVAFPWETSDLPDEGIVLECSTNAGNNWTIIGTYNSATYYNWTPVSLPIPSAAQSPATFFRWRQLTHSGTDFDHWALDHVLVAAGPIPPTIITQPQGQILAAGDAAVLSVNAYGSAPLTYQWTRSGTNIPGATGTSIAWTNAQLGDAGTYSVSLTNAYGFAISSNAIVTVFVPTCTPPPAGLVSWWAGETNAFDSTGSNHGIAVSGAGFAKGKVGQCFDLSAANSSSILVPDSPSLRLTNELTIEAWINARSLIGDQSLVGKVGGAGGNNGYQFLLRNSSLLAEFNSPGQGWPGFAISAPVAIAPGVWCHVAWTYDQSAMKLYFNGVPVSTNVVGPLSIASSTSNLRLGGDDNLHVYFDGLIDEASIYNRALTASEISSIYASASAGKCSTPLPPIIVSGPQSRIVAAGSTAALSVVAAGTPPLYYQWRFNGTNVSGATGSVLTIGNIQVGNSGNYDAVVTNSFGLTNSPSATITVLFPPQITLEPGDQVAGVGSNVTFNVTAIGSQPLSYQWHFNGSPLPGATASNLTLLAVTPTQAGLYNVVITNAVGVTNSRFAILSLQGDGACTTPPLGLAAWWPANGTVADSVNGNVGSFQGTASFVTGKVNQAFSFNLPNGSLIVPDSPSLRLSNQVTLEAWVNPRSLPGDQSIISKTGGAGGLNGYQLVLSSSSLLALFNSPGQGWPGYTISCPLTITTGVWHHIAWTYDQSAMKLYWDGLPAATNIIGPKVIATSASRLRISGDDNNNIYFDGLIDEPAVYNRALTGNEIASIYVAGSGGKCGLPPTILSQPQNQTNFVGSFVTFSVNASGTAPLAYQWQFSNSPIAGATSSTLNLTNIQLNQAGNYGVLITNALGSLLSSNAFLAINPPPPCSSPSTGMVGWWRGDGAPNDATLLNPGVLSGPATYTNGLIGQAFSFSLPNGSLIVPDSPSLRLSNQVTLEAWVNPRSLPGDQSVISKTGGAGGLNGYQLVLSSSSLVALFNSPGQGWPGNTISSPLAITTGVWHHMAWTYDQSAMKLYWDGLPVATNVIGPKAIATSASRLRVSGDDNNNVYFDGLIDEPAVYSRALSASEIASIYNAGAGGKCALPPVITLGPQNQIVQISSNAVFNVTATGLSPFSYRWYFNSNAIPAATNASLTVTGATFASAGSYFVVVSNVFGATTSAPANLTVIDTTPPTITVCPANRNLATGTECSAILPNLTVEVVASDPSGPVTVTQSPPPGTILGLGVTNVTFTVQDLSTNTATCISVVTVLDATPPFVVSNLTFLNISANSNCQSTLPDLTGTNCIVAADNCSAISITQSPPAGTLLGPGTNFASVTVRDAATNQTVRTISVVVSGEPHIVLQPTNRTVNLTSNALLIASACGLPPVQIQWTHAGTNIPAATNASLLLTNVQLSDSGFYTLIASNLSGSATSLVAALTVLQPPIILLQPTNILAVPGRSVSFSVSATGLNPLSFQWSQNGVDLPGRTAGVLNLTNIQPGAFGTYRVGITNADGGILSNPAQLTMATLPVIEAPGFNFTTFSLIFPSQAGIIYDVEYTDSLENPTWQVLTTAGGTGLPITITDNGVLNTHKTRYYRLRLR